MLLLVLPFSSYASPLIDFYLHCASSFCFSRALLSSSPQIGDTLEEFLLEAESDPKLRQLMMSMSEAIRTIAYKVQSLRSARCSQHNISAATSIFSAACSMLFVRQPTQYPCFSSHGHEARLNVFLPCP
jgi:hypothetical protein